MTERVVRLSSVARTRALGAKLGELLEPGDFVGLEGELGAGKTELVRAICLGAGVPPGRVSSPTFAIVATYEGGRLPILHADLYRLADVDELFATGFFDADAGRAASIVEWVDRVPTAAPTEHLHLRLEYRTPTTRAMTVRASGVRYEERIRAWLRRESRSSRRPSRN